jgi:hypothetical protein
VTGRILPENLGRFNSDLDTLLGRLRHEAGIPITRAPQGKPASITIEAMPRRQLQRLVPQAACFVVPGISSWDEYRRQRRSDRIDWASVRLRKKVAIFIPGDVSPQEMRDCLHEETAQALGPLNDLYRLPDSVFNDDNFHSILTGFDMLVLRAYYAPVLHNGMTRAQVARVLPGLLKRLNPGGEHRPRRAVPAQTPRDWISAIERALGARTSEGARHKPAAKAVRIARQNGWVDNRLAFSLYAYGRMAFSDNARSAVNAFLEAGSIYKSRPETQVQAAHVAMRLAAYALTSGEGGRAIELLNANLQPVMAAENAALLATMLMIKAEALEQVGRSAEARVVRLDSLGWARYGFGSQQAVRERLAEIAALTPRGGL